MEKFKINTIEYDLVDSYKYGENNDQAIRILKNPQDGLFYIYNYEGINDLYMGPYADAVKTGDNGEVLVKDVGKDYYYVPDPEVPKEYGVGFRKEYHPEYHFAEPYTYPAPRLYAPAKMTDGSIRIKRSSGRLSEESYDYYCCDPNSPFLDLYEKDGESFARAYDITLPLEGVVRPDSEFEEYQGFDVPSYQIAQEYVDYRNGTKTLEDLSYHVVMNDTVLGAILENEKSKKKEEIRKKAAQKKLVADVLADESKKTELEEMEFNLDELEKEINRIFQILRTKRELGVARVRTHQRIDDEAAKIAKNVSDTLSLENLIGGLGTVEERER